MRRWAYLVVPVLLLGLMGLLTSELLRKSHREPVYQGKGLNAWLRDGTRSSRPEDRVAAIEAMRAMGTNAIPLLLRMLTAEDSIFTEILAKLNETQSLCRFPYTDPRELNARAEFGFVALGTHASPAVPALMDVFIKRANHRAFYALVHICPQGVSALGQAMTNQSVFVTNKSHFRGGHIADLFGNYIARQRGGIPTSQEARAFMQKYAMPAQPGSQKADPEVLALAKLQTETMLPYLLRCLEDPDPAMRSTVACALVNVGYPKEKAIPFLISGLSGTDRQTRIKAALYLGSMGSPATSAIPALVKAFQDADPWVRVEATNALLQLDPRAAAKAGIKTETPGP